MTPLNVHFTGLSIKPEDLIPRIHRGPFPPDWTRVRFSVGHATTRQINQWLTSHAEGRWAILITYTQGLGRECTVAFERKFDASVFLLSDGAKECCSAVGER